MNSGQRRKQKRKLERKQNNKSIKTLKEQPNPKEELTKTEKE